MLGTMAGFIDVFPWLLFVNASPPTLLHLQSIPSNWSASPHPDAGSLTTLRTLPWIMTPTTIPSLQRQLKPISRELTNVQVSSSNGWLDVKWQPATRMLSVGLGEGNALIWVRSPTITTVYRVRAHW